MRPIASTVLVVVSIALAGAVASALPGCLRHGRATKLAVPHPRVQVYRVSDAGQFGGLDAQAQAAIAGARNEWVSFAVQVTDLPAGPWHSLRLLPLRRQRGGGSRGDGELLAAEVAAYQIVSMPVDVNRAGFVRHTGLTAAINELPRALLPLPMNRDAIDLRSLYVPPRRNPSQQGNVDGRQPTPAASASPAGPGRSSGTPRVWIDVRVPADAVAGDYVGSLDLMQASRKDALASLPVRLTVYDFALPERRNLQLVGTLSWDALKRLYPERFETVTPRLLNRQDPRYQPAVSALDELMALAHRHRAGLVIPRLQPTVKWPTNPPPDVDWRDYDSLVAPWVSGEAFADRVPLGFWPLPAPDFLHQYDRGSQLAYWIEAARHFDQHDLLDRSPVWMENAAPGRARLAEAVELSLRAGQILRLHNRLRVALPLEDDQVQLTGRDNPEMIDPSTSDRLFAAAPGLVFSPPTQVWPDAAGIPQYWLRTDMPGLVPYAGAGCDERDVRLWAWLAFLRHAGLIVWGDALPSVDEPGTPADPNETVWFYPGHWFGLDQPVPTVHLKWLRRAEQDYEYLHLARERGEVLNALLLARLITKPVEIQPGQSPDPVFGLMCGTTDAAAWEQVQDLLARTILIRKPGAPPPEAPLRHALNIDTLRWVEPQERPVTLGRTVRWLWDDPGDDSGRRTRSGPRVLNLRVGVDIYNASDNTPDRNLLRWTAAAPGWEVRPQPIEIPALATYHVRRESLEALFNLDQVTPEARNPLEVTFTSGFNAERSSTVKLVLPVAASERIEGRRLAVDGRLGEWEPADLIQDGPMVQMLSRPALQRQELRLASTPSRIYTAWGEDALYVAFALGGITPERLLKGSQNFVDYQFRRAWGEDLCSMQIQPVFDDNRVGPVLHIVCKPTGSDWVERKLDPRQHANPWQPLEGGGVRYRTTIERTNWLGEVAIPWRAILEPGAPVPNLLRFNFSQHRTATAESASWAGPVDSGRDDGFTGVLHLRQTHMPGIIGAAGGRP